MSRDISKTTDKSTYNKILRSDDEPYTIFGPEQDTLNLGKNGIPSTISIDRETVASSNHTNASVGEGRNAIKGEDSVIGNEPQAHEDGVEESKQCDTEKTITYPTTAASGDIDAHSPFECKDQGVNDKAPDVREYAVVQIVTHTQIYERWNTSFDGTDIRLKSTRWGYGSTF